MNSSILLLVRDEIALEGLQGITFDTLWIRLVDRSQFHALQQPDQIPVFREEEIKKASFQNIIFKITQNEAKKGNVQYFELPNERPPLVIFNRNDYYIEDTGTLIYDEKNIPDDIYSPIVNVQVEGVYGSCAGYELRRDVTKSVINLKDFKKFKSQFKCGQIAIVASQRMRAISLFGKFTWQEYTKLKPEQYLMLESIGRKRWYGEINFGKEAPKFKDQKINRTSYAYYRMNLQELSLIKSFSVSIFHLKRKQISVSSILYLPRFKPLILNPVDSRALEMADIYYKVGKRSLQFWELKQHELFKGYTNKRFRDFIRKFPCVFQIHEEEGEVRLHNYTVELLKTLDRPLTYDDLYEETDSVTIEDIEKYGEEDGETSIKEEDLDESMIVEHEPVHNVTNMVPAKLNLFKVRQLGRHFDTMLENLILQLGSATRVQLGSLCRIPNHNVRVALRYLSLTVKQLTSVPLRQGRQRTFHFRPLCITKSEAVTPSGNEVRIKILDNYLQEIQFSDSITLLRARVAQQEIKIGYKIDHKTILRLLNEMYDRKLVQLYHYSVTSGPHFRNAIFVISNQAEQKCFASDLVEHLLLRFKFLYFYQLPVNFSTQFEVTSMLCDDGKLKVFTSEINEMISNSILSNTFMIDEMYPTYLPSMARHYGFLSSKMEQLFEFYRYLFYLFIDTDDCPINDWRQFVPKLTHIIKDRECQLIDILIYMPISVFRNIVPIRVKVPGLDLLLQKPIERHQMIHQVSPEIRRYLFYSRKVVFDVFELVRMLSYLKLVTIIEASNNNLLRNRFRINTEVEIGENHYYFRTVADFDQFTGELYNHAYAANADQCLNCPFDPQLKIHNISLFAIRPGQARKKRKLSSEPERRRKQNLNAIKKKKVKMEILSNKNKVSSHSAKPTNMKTTRRLRNLFRPKWSREEDHFLLKCRLVSLLLCPTSRYQLCIGNLVVCELLQQHTGPVSHNKTPSSCSRRLLLLSRRPHIRRIVSVCLHELAYLQKTFESYDTQDSENLVKLFKQTLSKILNYRFANTEFFLSRQELNRLRETDNLVTVNPSPKLSNSEDYDLETLISEFELVNPYHQESSQYYVEPKNYYDVHAYVITNILISSLVSFRLSQGGTSVHLVENPGTRQERKLFMRTVFKSLKHFPDQLVKLVVKRLVKFEMIQQNKQSKSTKASKAISSSFTYKIAHGLFKQLVQYHVDYETVPVPNSDKDTDQAITETVIGDANSPFSVMHFAENFCCDILGMAKLPMQPSKARISQKGSVRQILPPSMLHKVQFQMDIPENFLKLPKPQLNGSIAESEPWRKMARCALLNRNSQLNPLEEGEEPERTLIEAWPDNVMQDDMTVTHCKVSIHQQHQTGLEVFSDSKIIELLKLHLRIYNQKELAKKVTLDAQLDDDFRLKIAHKFGSIRTSSEVIQLIISKSELGLKLSELVEFLQCQRDEEDEFQDELVDWLRTCEKQEVVFSVGVVQRTYVHRDFVHHWLVRSYDSVPVDHSDRAPKTNKPISFLPKLWKLPDGRLEVTAFFVYLNLLVGHLSLNRTSADFEKLVKDFSILISPVQLTELLEMLLSLDCIRRTKVTCNTSKCLLNPVTFDDFFNESPEDEIPDSPVLTETHTEYEVTIDAFSRLAAFYTLVDQIELTE